MITFLTPEEMAKYAKGWIYEKLTMDETITAKLSRKRFLVLLREISSLKNVQLSLCLFVELCRVEKGSVRLIRVLKEFELKIAQASRQDLEMLEYLQVEVDGSKNISRHHIRIIFTMLSKVSLRMRMELKPSPEQAKVYEVRQQAFSEFLRKFGFGYKLNPPIRKLKPAA